MAKRIGVEWVENYHGRADDLKNSKENTEGFYNKLSGVKVFNWGNDNAWDADFEQQGTGSPATGGDTSWADDVEIVYFQGHGWIYFGVANHDNGSASPSEMRLGDKKCRYLAIHSCEAMSDAGTSRWQPIFNGLRAMFGFKTTAHNVDDHGNKFAKYLNQGQYMDNAWKWACQETEGSSTEWGYIHTLSPQNSWNDKWTDSTHDAVPSPTLHFHSGAC
jgi:hypothetical protein